MLNMVRSFIPSLAQTLKPFHDMTREGVRGVNWKNASVDFKKVWIGTIRTAMALSRHEPTGEGTKYTLYTDWSKTGMGFALYARDRLI